MEQLDLHNFQFDEKSISLYHKHSKTQLHHAVILKPSSDSNPTLHRIRIHDSN